MEDFNWDWEARIKEIEELRARRARMGQGLWAQLQQGTRALYNKDPTRTIKIQTGEFGMKVLNDVIKDLYHGK